MRILGTFIGFLLCCEQKADREGLSDTNGRPVRFRWGFRSPGELIPWRGGIRAMAAGVKVKTEFSAAELRRLAAASKHASQSRRLLSIAAVLDGMSRADVAPRQAAETHLFHIC